MDCFAVAIILLNICTVVPFGISTGKSSHLINFILLVFFDMRKILSHLTDCSDIDMSAILSSDEKCWHLKVDIVSCSAKQPIFLFALEYTLRFITVLDL